MDKKVMYRELSKDPLYKFKRGTFNNKSTTSKLVYSCMGFKPTPKRGIKSVLERTLAKNRALIPLDIAVEEAQVVGILPNELSFYSTRRKKVYYNVDHFCYTTGLDLNAVIMYVVNTGCIYPSLVQHLKKGVLHNSGVLINNTPKHKQIENVYLFLNSITPIKRDIFYNTVNNGVVDLYTAVFLKLRFNIDISDKLLKINSFIYFQSLTSMVEHLDHNFKLKKYHKFGENTFLKMLDYYITSSISAGDLDLKEKNGKVYFSKSDYNIRKYL